MDKKLLDLCLVKTIGWLKNMMIKRYEIINQVDKFSQIKHKTFKSKIINKKEDRSDKLSVVRDGFGRI